MEEDIQEYPKFWKKAIKGSVGGRVLNKKGDEIEFLLKGDPNDPENDAAVEIFDEDGEKHFKRANKSAIKNGYLLEISDNPVLLDSTNAVSDGYLKDLLKQPFFKMKKEVANFTSQVPVARLLEIAMEENRPVKTIEFLQETLDGLQKSTEPMGGASIDNVTIKGM